MKTKLVLVLAFTVEGDRIVDTLDSESARKFAEMALVELAKPNTFPHIQNPVLHWDLKESKS